jgi:hypothetical protein
MASIVTDVPNLPINLVVDNIALLKEVSRVEIAGNKLTAQVRDGLSDAKYHELSKQLRILYSISFGHVYSEDYDVRDRSNQIGYGGHNERKMHLLEERISSLNENFAHTSQLIFKDCLKTPATVSKQTRFFNLAYIWARAQELQELKLLAEAYSQYWRILDEMHSRGTQRQAKNALLAFGLEESRSNIFAAQVLAGISREQRKSAEGEIVDIAKLDRLRHPHVHQAGGRQKYYLEEETHIEAMANNWLIASITELFILWQIGLDNYYLSPRANIYEIKKYEEEGN